MADVASQDVMPREDVAQLVTSLEFRSRRILTLNFGERSRQSFALDGLRHDDHPVGIADDEITGLNPDACAFDWYVDVGNLAAPLESSGPMPP